MKPKPTADDPSADIHPKHAPGQRRCGCLGDPDLARCARCGHHFARGDWSVFIGGIQPDGPMAGSIEGMYKCPCCENVQSVGTVHHTDLEPQRQEKPDA